MAEAFCALHDRVFSPVEQATLREHRRRLLARARGRVLDLGGGTGDHLRHYRADRVTEVDVAGPDPVLRPLLGRRLATSPVPVHLVNRPVADLAPAYDTIVCQFVLCALADPGPVLAVLLDLLEPDEGRLLFLEHAPPAPGRSVVTTLARPLWRSLTAGCDLGRDVPAELRRAGFIVTDLERFTMRTVQLPIRSCVAGVARRRRTGEAGIR